MTNKKQLITALTLATILIAGGFSMAPQAFSTGSGGNSDHGDDNKDKKGGEDSNKFKDWKKENDHHDDNNDDDHDKVKVCHIPPGNEGNAHTIEISESALASHLEHGDSLGACPDDNDDDGEDDLANIIFIRAITDDNTNEHTMADFTISINEEQIAEENLGLPIPIEPNTENTVKGTVPDGFKFVLISGDPACPVNINNNDGDTFTLKKGKSIVCTIYYDDLFVEGGSAGLDPKVFVTSRIIDSSITDRDFTYEIDGMAGENNTEFPITANTPALFTQTNHPMVLPSKITGDGNCPEALTGEITLSSGQNITCILEYGKEIEPGVVFHYNNLKFMQNDENLHDGCNNPTAAGIDNNLPCIFTDGERVTVADPALRTTTTIFLWDLLPVNVGDMANTSDCQVQGVESTSRMVDDGMGGMRPVLAFAIQCATFDPLDANDEPVLTNLNYAFIETVRP